MAFSVKDWQDEPDPLGVLEGRAAPTSRTPLNADALKDMERRLSDYTDQEIQAIPAPSASDIRDATTVGRNVLTAASQAAARNAIGAGTSSLTLGTSPTNAAAGNRGLPSGGTTGQVLAKSSNSDYAVTWAEPSSGGDHGGSGANSVSVGPDADASGDNSVAIGHAATASALYSLAFGLHSQASTTSGVAVGINSSATGDYAVAVGGAAQASEGVAIGVGARSDSTHPIFVGGSRVKLRVTADGAVETSSDAGGTWETLVSARAPGSASNPHTDPDAARNDALATNWWVTTTRPTNIAAGDLWVEPAA